MPQVSRFFGIVIYMYFNDHAPPHFHAVYGNHEIIYRIETLGIERGQLPRRAHGMVMEWASLHREDLQRNWALARQGQPLVAIDPLD